MKTQDRVSIDLPISDYRSEILASVAQSSVTIVEGETGSGKSTQVPKYLAEAGYDVIVTQPRRLAACSVAARVAEEMGVKLGEEVGYRTGEDMRVSRQTRVLFCTDGLQLVREIVGYGKTGGRKVLVLDEVHEWNLNMEVLVAWTKARIRAGEDLKVVLLSATIDTTRLSAFFDNAPVIKVPGRTYPVEQRQKPTTELLRQTITLTHGHHNVLVFVPDKRDIREMIVALKSELRNFAVVLPLHADLRPDEQALCFAPPPKGKMKVIVATNVAQTSVTIPDIDAVVDSGVERRQELREGIEGTYLDVISQADCLQRAGRAGRCKPGIYVLCSDIGFEQRVPFGMPEILRGRLDNMILRLAAQELDATRLEFFHQPDRKALQQAKQTLVSLGAMQRAMRVPTMGRRMARLPIRVEFARMLIEAERFGVVEQVATIVACLEAKEIRQQGGAWRIFTRETKSDLLAVLDVYMVAKDIQETPVKSLEEVLEGVGIHPKNLLRAKEVLNKLLGLLNRSVRLHRATFQNRSEERAAILKSCLTGMCQNLYRLRKDGRYENGSGEARELSRETVLPARNPPQIVVGLPLDIEVKEGPKKKKVIHLLTATTAVDPGELFATTAELLEESADHQ